MGMGSAHARVIRARSLLNSEIVGGTLTTDDGAARITVGARPSTRAVLRALHNQKQVTR